tara:strand:+ start:148 stop:465 length:318 start_codon:yes stop_codon:yes gene_type:complete
MTFEDSIHRVTLSGNEISSILYALEGWIKDNDEYNEGWDNTSKGGNLSLDIDNVFTALEEVADSWEGEFADPKVLDRDDIVVDTFSEDNYKDKVDSLVDRMKSTK